jgi:hypothetical protein
MWSRPAACHVVAIGSATIDVRGLSHRLHQDVGDLVGAAIVDQIIEEEFSRFDRPRVETFVPVLVERVA